MFSKNGIGIKELILTAGLALGAENALAKTPLPCPTNDPIVDKVGILQTGIKDQIENRLMTLDSQKHHQVTVITVNSLDEYGYDSFAEMGADMINECKIGYRGADTGIIVFYGANTKPHYFISTAAGVQGYITDATTQEIGRKSLEDCDKSNIPCRIDSITSSLDSIITQEFSKKEDVQALRNATTKFDENLKTDNSSGVLVFIGTTGALVLVIYSGFMIIRNIKISNNIKELNKKILALKINLGQEKAKYPEWFIERHILEIENKLNGIEEISEANLESNTKKLEKIENEIIGLNEGFTSIMNSLDPKKNEISNLIKQAESNYQKLEKDGFLFEKISLGLPENKSNPEDTLDAYNNYFDKLSEHLKGISAMSNSYTLASGENTTLNNKFSELSSSYNKSLLNYEQIFGKYNTSFDLEKLRSNLARFLVDFNLAYEAKDLNKVTKLYNQRNGYFSDIERTISDLNSKISWYNSIPSKLSSRENELSKYNYSSSYEKAARDYKQESGKRDFENFDMQSKLSNLSGILSNVKSIVQEKKGFEKIDSLFSDFDSEIVKISAYIGLGELVMKLIADRLAEEAREEQRRRQREQDEEDERNRRNSSSSSSGGDSGPSWTSGGGGGGDGGGGGFD